MGGTRRVEDWIEGYCELLSTTESPDIYKRWMAISTVAAALRRKCWLSWHNHVDTHPNMYIVLVGPPAIGKGMAMGPARQMLAQLNVPMSSSCTTLQALIQDLLAAEDTRQIDGMPVISSSLTVLSPEFAVFLGRNNGEFCDKITDLYDCPSPWSYQTMKRGDERLEAVFLNLIGATTPGLLQATMSGEAITGGLMSRVILVYADAKSRIVPIPSAMRRDEALRDKLFTDLGQIAELEGKFMLAPEVIEPWVDWYVKKDTNDELASDRRFAAYCGRRDMHMLKLMMILSASRSNEMVLRLDDFTRALQYLSEAERQMPKAFRGYGNNVLSAFIAAAQGEIESVKFVYLKDFKKRHLNDVSAEDIDRVLRALESTGFCKIVLGEKGNQIIKYTGG
jgi:hypothetical protein